MLNTNLWKYLTQSAIALTLFSSLATAFPSASYAQKPVLKQAPTTQGTTIDTNYTLGGGDRIRVNVFEVPEYTGEYQIPPGGAINLPLIGSVTVQGLTTEEAADDIAKRYARYLKRPLISVNLLSPRPINVFVAGEVSRPGAYTISLQGGAGNDPGVQYPTVLAALTTAQGVTLSADITQVELRRKGGRNGAEKRLRLNLKELTRTGQLNQDITLRDGDTIFVPTATDINNEQYLADLRNFTASNFAADVTKPRTVAIIGEVNRPGSYLVTQGDAVNNANAAPVSGLPTVSRAIQLAGGISPQADIRNVVLRRPTRTGSEQKITLNLWQILQSGDTKQDIIVQEGDTIIIPTATEINPAEATQLAVTTLSPTKIQVGVVGEVKKPGQVDLQPNSTLNQALLAAGGFEGVRASSSTVDLIRLNPDGSVTKRKVKVDFAAGINEQTNPILRNNDVVVVYRNGVTKTSETISSFINPFSGILGVFRALFGF
ncbi:polysaccharide biosynthesis/export family protein [Calothrix sp. 336/3]|uniref:polysaccharide biosynthesis/export family protein n=1 Tax=Calothrix sp. 336/3 TaxID=1337936 RepID=UPI0004E34AC7|nr:polysaccharide biosynthesis/export family protein [Calothrix sp. 336/3]AKG24061.1 polysaccharide export protein [Calothrix sp. 336/3]